MVDENKRPMTETETALAVGVSVSTLRRLIEHGDFPEGIQVSSKTKVWVKQDVDAYLHLKGRVRSKTPPQPPPKGKSKDVQGG